MNLKQMNKMEDKIKTIAPSIRQLIIRDLGKYGGNSGVNKFFFLINVIDSLITHIGEDIVIERFNQEIGRLKEFQEKTGQSTIYDKIQNWDQINRILDNLRPRVSEIQFAYDDIGDKKFKDEKKELDKKLNYKKLTKKVSPYQLEIYFLFNLLMKISSMQHQTIPPEAFRTPESSKYSKSPFVKSKISHNDGVVKE